jgi:outer membrane protein assembly factor BamA
MRLFLTHGHSLLGAIVLVLYPLQNSTQLPPKLQSCSDQPVSPIESKYVELEEGHPTINIKDVTVQAGENLPEAIKTQVIEAVKRTSLNDGARWTGAVEEIVRDILQQHGYLFSQQTLESHVISEEPQIKWVSVTIDVNLGGQYRLKEIGFKRATVFPVEQLRSQFGLHDGDIFDLRKIRQGFEGLARLYGSQGYINSTASPDLHPDNAHRLISMTVELDPGEQFRVGSVKILGLDPQIALDGLKTKFREGDVFDPKSVRDFYIDNKSVLPADATSDLDTEVKQDPRKDTVAIVFDFRPCPRNSR